MEGILFARKGTMLNDAMIGRRSTRPEAPALRQLLVDVVPDGQEYAVVDIALV